ncbi:MAG: hypothetical protein IJR89_03565 [Clostridia bacterium]|nr:hypothetical protein [Clostridia bacterium]
MSRAAVLLFCFLLLVSCAVSSPADPLPEESGRTETLQSAVPGTETAAAARTDAVTDAATVPPDTAGAPGTAAPSSPEGTTAPPETDLPDPEPPETTPTEPEPPETEPVTDPPETAAPEPPESLPEDTSAPFFLAFNRYVALEKGSKFNIHRYLSYADDLDPDVVFTVTGTVDPDTVGVYPLSLEIRDAAGNASYASMEVEIVEAFPPSQPVEPEPPRAFDDFLKTYQNENAAVGIDVSRWQGEIDFERVAAAGCEFVIIRIGGYADGLFEDPYYRANIRGAKKAGLKVGVYWYSEENGPAAVREHAAYLYELLDGEELDLPVFFDWEDFLWFETYRMSLRDLNEMFLAFREEAEARGCRAALYNSKYYLGLLWNDAVKEGGVWLAHYVDETSYTGEYFLWQQGIGRIDGIDGDVDYDVFYPGRLAATPGGAD